MEFPIDNLTLLITHYERANSLARLLRWFSERGIQFSEILVSDDGSSPETLDYLNNVLAAKYGIFILASSQNKGLPNNLNKAMRSIKSDFVLYVQEDFEPTDLFPATLQKSLGIMMADASVDIIRFFSHSNYPYLIPFSQDNDFSWMKAPLVSFNYMKVYAYSDTPHLRRNDFSSKFGLYREDKTADKAEYYMCLSFLKKGGKGLFHKDYTRLFLHKNLVGEPSTMKRSVRTIGNNFFLRVVRSMYRQVKYNYDIHIRKLH